ncbi:MAG: CvpA family protein [Rikenellaceae bacterium]
MNVFDIVIGIILLYALYAGFRQGIVVQLSGIIGIIAGVYLAYQFASVVAKWFDLSAEVGLIVGFICILIVVIIALAIIGRLIRGLFKITGLGVLDKIFGAALSALKIAFLIGILLSALSSLSDSTQIISKETIDSSYLYKPVQKVSEYIFPYISFIKDNLPEFK